MASFNNFSAFYFIVARAIFLLSPKEDKRAAIS